MIKFLRGEDWEEDYKIGVSHLKKYPWLYDAVIEELSKVFDVSVFK
ncbi:hypothetical protein PNA2_1635 [Pyrococcus sp. NA2]|nr:hypothetical protein PNA2_1635 [Pyrococcus sp. NA2]